MHFFYICVFLLVLYLVCVLLNQYVNKQAFNNNNLLLSLVVHLSTGYLQSYRLGLCSFVMVIYIALGRRPQR